MPRNRKTFIHNSVVEVTFRAEENLPLVATAYMKLILGGILAQAQNLYPVTVCHFVLMANHVHLLLVVEDPECVPAFIGYFKRESSHVVNKLTGRKKRTIWCDGYDSPVVLDPEKVIQRIVYLYTNPSRAGLVDSIEDYPNLNSWQSFIQGGGTTICRKIPRYAVTKLPDRPLSRKQSQAVAEKLFEESIPRHLCIDPDAWLKCFHATMDIDPEYIRDRIVREVREQEDTLRQVRTIPAVGAKQLELQDPRCPHTPAKFGKRMICLSSEKSLRLLYIEWFKQLSEHCAHILKNVRRGVQGLLPPGFFNPGGFLLSNLSPPFSPLPVA